MGNSPGSVSLQAAVASRLWDASAVGAGLSVVDIGHSLARGCMEIAAHCGSCPKGRGTYCWAAEANELASWLIGVPWLLCRYGKKLKREGVKTLGVAGESMGVSWLRRCDEKVKREVGALGMAVLCFGSLWHVFMHLNFIVYQLKYLQTVTTAGSHNKWISQ